MRIVSVDETYFGSSTVKRHIFNSHHNNHSLFDKNLHTEVMCFIMAISEKYGLESYYITNGKVDSRVFCKLIPQIIARGTWCIVVMDNWIVHKSKYTQH